MIAALPIVEMLRMASTKIQAAVGLSLSYKGPTVIRHIPCMRL